MDQFDIEEEELTNAVNNGEITEKEYRECMRDLRIAYQETQCQCDH